MNSGFKELLAGFNAHRVEYLVVGANALAPHGHVRATKDLDVWVRPRADNADRAFRALAALGAPLHELRPEDLAQPGLIFQIGVPPLRVDVLTEIDGVEFEAAWANRQQVSLGGITVPVLSRSDLIASKKAAGRLQDLADVERLEQGE